MKVTLMSQGWSFLGPEENGQLLESLWKAQKKAHNKEQQKFFDGLINDIIDDLQIHFGQIDIQKECGVNVPDFATYADSRDLYPGTQFTDAYYEWTKKMNVSLGIPLPTRDPELSTDAPVAKIPASQPGPSGTPNRTGAHCSKVSRNSNRTKPRGAHKQFKGDKDMLHSMCVFGDNGTFLDPRSPSVQRPIADLESIFSDTAPLRIQQLFVWGTEGHPSKLCPCKDCQPVICEQALKGFFKDNGKVNYAAPKMKIIEESSDGVCKVECKTEVYSATKDYLNKFGFASLLTAWSGPLTDSDEKDSCCYPDSSGAATIPIGTVLHCLLTAHCMHALHRLDTLHVVLRTFNIAHASLYMRTHPGAGPGTLTASLKVHEVLAVRRKDYTVKMEALVIFRHYWRLFDSAWVEVSVLLQRDREKVAEYIADLALPDASTNRTYARHARHATPIWC
jgi:hypothetical protein